LVAPHRTDGVDDHPTAPSPRRRYRFRDLVPHDSRVRALASWHVLPNHVHRYGWEEQLAHLLVNTVRVRHLRRVEAPVKKVDLDEKLLCCAFEMGTIIGAYHKAIPPHVSEAAMRIVKGLREQEFNKLADAIELEVRRRS
jgi:hypothetical protein